MEWTREKTLILIDEYKKKRGLWDMTHEDYRKKDIKRELLAEVAEKIDTSLPNIEIEKKFHTLRTQYHREINRMKNPPGVDYKSKWFAFKHLDFLSSPKACRTGKTDFVKIKSADKATTSLEHKKKSPARYIIKELNNTNPVPETMIATEFLTIHKKPNTTSKNQTRKRRDNESSRKDLEKLIEETTNEENEDNLVEDAEFKPHLKQIQPISQQTFSATNIQSFEQYFEDTDAQLQTDNEATTINATVIHDVVNEFQPAPQSTIIRLQKREMSAIDQCRDSFEEETQQPSPQTKKLFVDNRANLRDEFTTYGEYVSNEMRLITSRDILVPLKHKINIALFEASMAQLQK